MTVLMEDTKAYRFRRNGKKCGVKIGKRWVVSLWGGRHAQNRFRSKIAFFHCRQVIMESLA